jgi:hypothetical protein
VSFALRVDEAERELYLQQARECGLVPWRAGAMLGRASDVRIELRLDATGTPYGELRGCFRAPLDVGLVIVPEGDEPRAREPLGLDLPRLRTSADDPARARLLFDGDLAPAIADAVAVGPRVLLSDDGVAIQFWLARRDQTWNDVASWLPEGIEALRRVVTAVDAAQRGEQGTATYRDASALERHGLTPLVIPWGGRGELDGCRVDLALGRDGSATFQVAFPEMMTGGLHVATRRPKGALERLLGEEEQGTGDVAFDRAFFVTALRALASTIVDARVRASLLALEARGAIRIDDDRVMVELQSLDAGLEHVPTWASIARALFDNTRPAKRGYR